VVPLSANLACKTCTKWGRREGGVRGGRVGMEGRGMKEERLSFSSLQTLPCLCP